MILGVSFDTPAENKKFAEKYHFNFPLICDTDRKIGTAYGANVDPQKGAQRVGVVIDRDGKIKEWHGRVDARAWPAEVMGTLKPRRGPCRPSLTAPSSSPRPCCARRARSRRRRSAPGRASSPA